MPIMCSSMGCLLRSPLIPQLLAGKRRRTIPLVVRARYRVSDRPGLMAGRARSSSIYHTRAVVGFALPALVLLIQDDVLAGNPQHEPVPQHDQSFFVVSLLDHCDSAIEHCHAVALFQGALPLAADVVLLACLDQVLQSRRVEA